MAEVICNDRNTRRWTTQHLSGLGVSLETLMELQAILNEIVGYHASFEQKNDSFTGTLELPVDKTAFLAKQVQRVMELRDATRQEFINLGEALQWCGFAADDLKDLSKKHSAELCGLKAIGFDRKNMIDFGRKIIALLRRSQSAMASVHLATNSLRQPLAEVADKFTASEWVVYEYLDCLTSWADDDLDRVRDLFQAYTAEIKILEQQETNNVKVKAG